MPAGPPYRLFADFVLALHCAVAGFVVAGLVLIIAGNLRGWHRVNAPWFRVAHLGSIGVVVSEAWLGITCPLTTLEAWLRAKDGADVYSTGFIEHWLQRLLFHQAPAWVFVLGYTVFGLMVLAAWWRFPPRFKNRNGEGSV